MCRGQRFRVMSLFLTLLLSFFISSSTRAYSIPKNNFLRLGGEDRYKTAVLISQEGWESSDWVILTAGNGKDRFADALAGTTLSYVYDAPILLVDTNGLNKDTSDELERLGAKNAYILGGTSALPSTVKRSLEKKGMSVTRIHGSDRYETAVKIASEIRKSIPFTKVLLTTGYEFQYAMMSAPFAARENMPILYTDRESLTPKVKKALAEWGIKEVHIIGNSSIISDVVVSELKNMGVTTLRIEGSNMQQTNINVVKNYHTGSEGIALVRDDVFADGMAGGPLAAKRNIPIFLVGPGDINDEISSFAAGFNKNTCLVFGGSAVISDDYLDIVLANDTEEVLETNNTSGNIVNEGIAALADDWIYFSHISDGWKLYKSRPDGTRLKKITDNKARYINVSEDFIYYVNESDKYRLYKIKPDGSDNQKISDDRALFPILLKDYIYYINFNDGRSIYRIGIDGSGNMKIVDDDAYFLCAQGDWLYYCSRSDGNKIYKVRMDGTGREKICDDRASHINVSGLWVYYINLDQENKIYRVRVDGTANVKVTNDASYSLNITDGWIYYANGSRGSIISRMKLDGTEKENLNFDASSSINLAGEWVFYFNEGQQKLFKMKIDGTERQSVFIETPSPLVIPHL